MKKGLKNHMRRFSLAAAMTVFAALSSYGQKLIDANMDWRPAEELFRLVENESGCRIFAPQGEIDSVRITVHAAQTPPAEVLRKAFSGTPYEVSAYGNSIFVVKGRRLMTELPTKKAEAEAGPAVDSTTISLDNDNGSLLANSDLRVYHVGDPTVKAEGKLRLNGHVLDAASGEPVVGVMLRIGDTNTTTYTDNYGFYSFNLEPGDYEINIVGGGQADAKRRVRLYSDGQLDIQSAEKVMTFKEIAIYGGRRDNVRQTAIGVERLKINEIKNIPMAFGEVDIMKVVTALPGVKSVGEISSGFNVRGGASDQNLILFNGGAIYNPMHLFGLFSAFNPDIIRDMELYKSSVPPRYGGRISSVLDINSREGNKKKFGGTASIGLLTSRLALEGPIVRDKTSFLVAGRTTYSDWLLGLLPEKSGYKNGNAGFWDVNASLSHKFSERDNLYINGYYSRDRFSFDKTAKYRYSNGDASVKWRHVFNSQLVGVFTAGYDHYDYENNDMSVLYQEYKLRFNMDQYSGSADFSWLIGNNHNLSLGVSSIFYNLSPGKFDPLNGESLIQTDVLQREKAVESAVWVGDQWKISDRVSIDAGIRYSIFNAVGPRIYNTYNPDYLPSEGTVIETIEAKGGVSKTYHGPEFRVSGRVMLTDDLSLKAGVNSMRQYVHKVSNTSIMSPTDTWKLSDVNISPQTGIQYAAGLYKDFRNAFVEISVEGYYKTMSDYLDYRNGAELIMNHNLETDVVPTQGRAYGIEVMVRRTQGKLNGWVSYTWSRTLLRQFDPRMTSPVNDGDWYPADFDKPHEFKFIGNYKFTHRFSVSLNIDYATGRPVTLPVSKYEYAGGSYVYYSDRNGYRVPDYFRIDMSVNIEPKHRQTQRTHSSVTLGVYNLTGRQNAHSVYYEKSDSGAVQGYKLSIFGAPIPYINYNIRF